MPSPFPAPRPAGSVPDPFLNQVRELHSVVQEWASHIPTNGPYVDLMFAFGLAMLGDSAGADEFEARGRVVLEGSPPPGERFDRYDLETAALAHPVLAHGFRDRIRRTQAGEAHGGSLSPDVLAELDALDRAAAVQRFGAEIRATYVCGRMREWFRILDPDEPIDPYANWSRDGVRAAVAELPSVRNLVELQTRVRSFYPENRPEKSTDDLLPVILPVALPLSTRVGAEFAVEVLERANVTLGRSRELTAPDNPQTNGLQLSRLLNAALAAASDAPVCRRDLTELFVRHFLRILTELPADEARVLAARTCEACVLALERVAAPGRLNRFLHLFPATLLQHAEAPGPDALVACRNELTARPEEWGRALQSLLTVAGGWAGLGLPAAAAPTLAAVRDLLLTPGPKTFQTRDYSELAGAYITALGRLTPEEAFPRLFELFRDMPRDRITNTWTTAKYFSRCHLALAEETVLAVCRLAGRSAPPPATSSPGSTGTCPSG